MDEKIYLVLQKLNDLRQELDPDERAILDQMLRVTEEDEVEGHRIEMKAFPRLELRIEKQIYTIIEK